MDKVDCFLKEIEDKNSVHYRQINKIILNFDNEWREFANKYLYIFETYLVKNGKELSFGIECYLKIVKDMVEEQYKFFKTGEYSCKTIKEAIEKVYSKQEVMEYYMIGLMFSQLFWKSHYEIFRYFSKNIEKYLINKKKYLEIGGGHGLFTSEVIKKIKDETEVTIVDISETSLKMSQDIIDNENVKYICSNILEFENREQYDFITMGEVLEHVEKPNKLLEKIYNILKKDGIFFITVPINSPAIDHIYLFNNENEIRKMILSAGFKIEDEILAKSENIKKEYEEKFKLSKIYGAFLKK